VVLWRADDATTPDARVDRLLGLQQAMFLVRADLVDALYVHRQSDLPSEDLALIAAEVDAAGGTLIVADRVITSPRDLSDEEPVVELAQVGASMRAAIAPRLSGTSGVFDEEDLDIGASDTRADAARLAHKLREEFLLPGPVIGDLIADAEYYVGGTRWNRQMVSRLVTEADSVAQKATLDEVWGSELAVARDPLFLTYVFDDWTGSKGEAELVVREARTTLVGARRGV